MRFLAGTNIGGNLTDNVRGNVTDNVRGNMRKGHFPVEMDTAFFFSANTAFYHGGIGVFSAKMANIMGTNIKGNVRDNVRGNMRKWHFPVELDTAFFFFFLTNMAFYHGGIGVFSAKMANIIGKSKEMMNYNGNSVSSWRIWRFFIDKFAFSWRI